ncbi:MAG TPA: YbhB/YbcL family Raf kinase inhibitor-like protein [Ignavibacteria bacterium]
MFKIFPFLVFFSILITSCKKETYDNKPVNTETKQEKKSDSSDAKQKKNMNIKIKSAVFEEGGMIPKKYTCDGENISPPLSWADAPDGTKTYALICDDPDAPAGTWVHWVMYNMPANTKELSEAVSAKKNIDNGAIQGINDFRKTGYGGPCPPGGTHRYFFKIYALNTSLDLRGDVTKDQLLSAMSGHILAEGQLMGKYSK